MSSIIVPSYSQALTADGGADGFVTVTDSSGFYPGAEAWLSRDNVNQRVIITELAASNKVGVRFIPTEFGKAADGGYAYPSSPAYGSRNSAAAFTTLLNSRLDMPTQCVRVEPTFTKVARV